MDDLPGRLALSLAGRDKGNLCVITGFAPEDGFVLTADGRTRKVEAPKKKKLKHLKLVDWVPEEDRRIEAAHFTNRLIREFIARHGETSGSPM